MVRESQENGHFLKPMSIENIVLVKYIKCKNSRNENVHVLCCYKCNPLAELVVKNLQNVQVLKKEEIENMKLYCKHTMATEILDYDEEYETKNKSEKNVTLLQEHPHISATLASDGSYGLIFCNTVYHAKSGKCHWPHNKYKNCNHMKIWNKETGKEVIKKCSTTVGGQNEDGEEEQPIKFVTPIVGKIQWPLDELTQTLFCEIEKERFSSLTHLIPPILTKLRCKHENKFDSGDPIKNSWIMSRNVRIYHLGLIESRPKVVYFRPTEGTCECRQSYTGEDDMLLVARLTPYHKGGVDAPCDLISYPLLIGK